MHFHVLRRITCIHLDQSIIKFTSYLDVVVVRLSVHVHFNMGLSPRDS